MATFTLSKKYIFDLIISFEITSRSNYIQNLIRPIAPPLQSGVTVGIGLDLGYLTRTEISEIFKGKIPDAHLNLLINCAGLKGDAARLHLRNNRELRQVQIPYELAEFVFYNHTLPKHCASTLRVYRDVVKLHPIEQTAIVGLVFNRGNDVSDTDRRREMRQLIAAIQQDNDTLISDRILSMRRLWVNKGADGLLRRRTAEAAAISLPDTILISENDKLIINC